MVIKKSVLGNLSSKSLEDSYRCNECLHFRKHAHPTMQEICSKKGIRPFAIAPKCFTPDVTQIADNSDTFVQLAAMFSAYNAKQKRIMMAVLKQKPITGKAFRKDMPFGTKVYFHGLGKDYISNYLSGYVMGVTSSGELIITGSPERNTRGRSYMAYMNDTDHLMTIKEWRVKKAALRSAGRVLDPTAVIIPKQNPDSDPVTIDSAPEAWHDKQEKKKKRRRSTDMIFNVS